MSQLTSPSRLFTARKIGKVTAKQYRAIVAGRSMSTPALTYAARAGKRQRFGKDQGSFKISTTFVYNFRLITYAVNQSLAAGGTLFPLVNVPAYYPETEILALTSTEWSDWECNDPQTYHMLNPRTALIVVDAAQRRRVTNSLINQGVRYMVSEEIATQTNPYYTSYLGFKVDANGFNCCDPTQFSTLCGQFGFVKQGPYAVTFNFQEVTGRDVAPYRTYHAAAADPPNTGFGAAFSEIHGLGYWEYIVIPARHLASVMLPSIMGSKNWEKLIDMGFKIQKCGRTHTIYCAMQGADLRQVEYVRALAAGIPDPAVNQIDNASAAGLFNTAQAKGRVTKHVWVDTEKACQSPLGVPYPNTAANLYPGAVGTVAIASNFGCVPFGSAIVFSFKQYAPVNPLASILQTARRQVIPIEIRVDSFTKFKSPTLEQLDLEQQNPFPFQQ